MKHSCFHCDVSFSTVYDLAKHVCEQPCEGCLEGKQ